MKKIALILISLLTTITVFSQDHLTFMGLSIDGTTKDFSKKLNNKQFKTIEYLSFCNGIKLNGMFLHNDSCTIFLLDGSSSKKFDEVVVQFLSIDDVEFLNIKYDAFISIYTDKYGEPTENRRNNIISQNSVTWILDNGTINMWLLKPKNIIVIKYIDKINSIKPIEINPDI